MSNKFSLVLEYDFSALNEAAEYIQNNLNKTAELPRAVEAVGNFGIQTWLDVANSKFVHSSGGYARGIVNGLQYPYNNDPLHFFAENLAPYARALEDGFDAFDMKKALESSDKVRISKDGKKYLVIPFRHGTPGSKMYKAMPKEVYDKAPFVTYKDQMFVPGGHGAKNMKQSHIVKTYKEGSVKDALTAKDADVLREQNSVKVTRNSYQWGDKLKDVGQPLLRSEPKQHTITGKDGKKLLVTSSAHKGNIYEGMVRFQHNVNVNREMFNMGKFTYNIHNETDNMTDSSSYLTFRVMSEDSQGWIHPGMTGMGILKETYDRIKGPGNLQLQEAAQNDVQNIINSLTQ